MKELSFSQQRLLEAITYGRIYQTRQLLEAGTPAEFLDEEGYSPLFRACFIQDERYRTRTNLIKLLIVYGADVNTTDPQGRHVLTYACITENQEMVQLLLDTSIHDIDLNKKDFNGDTPLIHCVRLGNVNLVTILVDAMNKFRINMDVRNNADRTPYLEAKHLGRTECAQLLLEKASASTEVQVNPFLDFIGSEEEKYRYGGDVRGVDWRSKKIKGTIREEDKNRYNLIHQHQGKPERSHSKQEIKIVSHVKRLPKRQGTKPRALRNRNTEKTTGIEEKKISSNKNPETCVTQVLREIQECNGKNETDPDVRPDMSDAEVTKENTIIATGKIEKQNMISVSETPVTRERPATAVTTRRELKDAKNRENRDPLLYDTFLTDGTPVRPPSHRVWVPHHPRSKTAPPKRFIHSRQSTFKSDKPSAERYSVDDNDQISWYSHFSIHTSPSANFMNKIMAMYAEQVSPQSSYRKGVKPRKSEYAPTIVAPPDGEHDKHSDGRRSSSGSVRSLSGSVRNRRFSAITKTVASYISSRKAMTASKNKN